jgi:hypothetical protein
MQPKIKEIAKEIDRETFVSWFEYGSIMDPYNTGYEGEDNSGRVWWVRNRDGDGPPVTAWDFIEAHPEMDLNAMWDEIYGREEQWSRDTDPFHGIFR